MNRTYLILTHAIALLAILLLTVQPVSAGCPVTFRQAYHAPTYVAPVEIVKERIVEKVFNFARIVEIPLYSTYIGQPIIGAYGLAPAPAAAAAIGALGIPHKSECAEALAGFKAMQAKVSELEAKLVKGSAPQPVPQPTPTMPPATDPGIDPFTPSPQALKGTSLRTLTPEEVGAFIDRVTSYTMPPKDPQGHTMPAAERLELISAYTGGKVDVVAKIVGKHCASCHNGATAKVKGGGFVLVK
jgi:hypothetical protein